jgi:MinD-like ATPase involved in chromosome partitioning or flagellar assembly
MPLLGWVGLDPQVGVAVRRRRPVLLESPRCPASRDLRALGAAFAGSIGAPAGPAEPARSGIAGWLARTILRGG